MQSLLVLSYSATLRNDLADLDRVVDATRAEGLDQLRVVNERLERRNAALVLHHVRRGDNPLDIFPFVRLGPGQGLHDRGVKVELEEVDIVVARLEAVLDLSLIHISEPTRLG